MVGNRASTLEAGNDINLEAGNDVQVRGAQFHSGRDINVTGRDIVLDVARGEQSYDSQQSQGKGGIVGGTSGGFKVGIGGSRGVAGEEGSQGTASAAVLNAERDVNLNARNDLNLIGTQVQAGRDIDLKAGNDLKISAAQNASDSESTRRSGGGEVGLTFGSEGVGVYVSVNVGKGDLEREGQRQQEAYLYAGDRLNFTSGRDTAIGGAQLSGDEVIGRVGRDLTVTSLPDTGKVKGREFDVSATATFGPGAGFSASVGYGETTGSTEWVENQTRIVARDRLDIRTEEHTQIDGALIASNTGNLKLDTGTLGFSDIAGHDKEHSYYLNVGGSYGKNDAKDTQQDKSQEGKGEKGKTGWSVEGYEYEKDRQQIVRATVGEGEIVVRGDAGTGSDSTVGLNRDVSKAYEITRDEEERTDLYVTKSSVEAAASPIQTIKTWGEAAKSYAENSEKAAKETARLWEIVSTKALSADGIPTRVKERLGEKFSGQMAEAVRLVGGDPTYYFSGLSNDSLNIVSEVFKSSQKAAAEFSGNGKEMQEASGPYGAASNGFLALGPYSIILKDSPFLDAMVAANEIMAKLPLEEARNLQFGLQFAMGPVKAAVSTTLSVAANIIAGDAVDQFKEELAISIVAGLTGQGKEAMKESHAEGKQKYAEGKSLINGDTQVAAMRMVVDLVSSSISDKISGGAQRVIHVSSGNGTKGDAPNLLPKPGDTSLPASGVGAGVTFKVESTKQLGKKLGRHVEDFGGDPSNPVDRKMVFDRIQDIGSNPEKVIPGLFSGQGAGGVIGDVFFRIKGNDVVVTKLDGSFVTILKDGVIGNTFVKNALKGQ